MEITTATNSFWFQGKQYGRGALTVTYGVDSVSLGNNTVKISDLKLDGQSFSTSDEVKRAFDGKIFNKSDVGSAGSGGVESVTGTLVTGTAENPVIDNPLLEIHHMIVVNNGTRQITDFAGTISVVGNGLDTMEYLTLNWDAVDDDTRELTVIFTLDVPNIVNVGLNGVTLSNIPNTAKSGDVWKVVYDKQTLFNRWYLVSWFSKWNIDNKVSKDDLSSMPAPNKVPVFSEQGLLSTGIPEFPENAVPLSYLDSRIPAPPTTGSFVLKSSNGTVSWVAE